MIITTLVGLLASGFSAKANLTKLKGGYIPSKRGISIIENAVLRILKNSPEIKRQIRLQIKFATTSRTRTFYARQLSRALSLEKVAKQLKSRMKSYRLAESKGKLLSVIDMNPLIETSKLLKLQGKNEVLYHASTSAIKEAFKKGNFEVIKPAAAKSVAARVRQKTFYLKEMWLRTRNKLKLYYLIFGEQAALLVAERLKTFL